MSAVQPRTPGEGEAVQLIGAAGEWFVRVIARGHQPALQEFDDEDLAAAFAEKQRLRLGLADIERV